MNIYHHVISPIALALFLLPATAGEYLDNKTEVDTLLKGKQLNGLYLRTQSSYSLQFNADGSLSNQRNEKGKWWVNEQGEYCREWLTGRLKGNRSCMNLAQESGELVFYSKDRKVATGTLSSQ
ncbi:MAG: hypothetical protein ABW162_15775 [Candidatus Sedimenticola sp. PURPLELP]